MDCGSCGECCGKSRSILKGIQFPLPVNMSITDYFRKCLLVDSIIDPEAPAVISADGKSVAYTFRELDSLSTKFAKALRQSLGFWTSNSPDGDLIMAFSLPVSEIIPIVILAILKLGAAFLAIPITFAEQHIIKLVGVTRPMVVIIESSKPTVARYECVSSILSIFFIDELLYLALNGGFDDINEVFPLETLVRPYKRMASIVYTAGTMDQQLAVRIGHLEILNRCLWQYKAFPYEEHEVGALSSYIEDVDSIAEIFAPLLAGVPLHLISRYVLANPTGLISRIATAKISRITLAPPGLATLLTTYEGLGEEEKNKLPLASLRYWTISGDTLRFDLAIRFFKLVACENCLGECGQSPTGSSSKQPFLKPHSSAAFAESESSCLTAIRHPILIHLYGSTEVMSDVSYETFENCCHVRKKFMNGKVSIGKPIGNTIIYVVDEDMKIVEEGTIGEICVAGACVASGGYVGGTDKEDAERFRPNPFTKRKRYTRIYETEDFGKITENEDGIVHLFYEGRTEMIAKVKGKIVDLRDIAKYVNETGLVEQCSAFCYQQGKEDQAIVACCKLLPKVTQEQLESAVRKSSHDLNFVVFPVDEFHYLPSGRLDKHKMFKGYKYHIMSASPEDWEPITAKLTFPVQKNAAKVLFTAIAMFTGQTVRSVMKQYTNPMWSVGIDSITALSVFLKVRESGYLMDLNEFLTANSILDIVFLMRAKSKGDVASVPRSQIVKLIHSKSPACSINVISPTEKEKVVKMLSKSYFERNYLACYLAVPQQAYKSILEINWKKVMKENLSVYAHTLTSPEVILGACIVLDANTNYKLPPNCPQNLKYYAELIQHCEKGPKEHIIWKKKGAAVQILMMAVADTISSLESILLIMQLLEAAKTRAKSAGYNGVIISGASPLLRDLCSGVLQNKMLEEISIYKFRAKDKTMPFRLACHHHKFQVFYDSF